MPKYSALHPVVTRGLWLAIMLGLLAAATAGAQDADASVDVTRAASEIITESADKARKAAEEARNKPEDIQKQIDAQAASGKQTEATLAELQKMLKEQQQLIEAQKQEIERQKAALDEQSRQLSTTTTLLNDMQAQIDQLSASQQSTLTADEVSLRQRLESLESKAAKITDDPSSLLEDESFPGAIRVPGTTSAFKIGGFIKASIVKNFDPLTTKDRFIVGGIPVTDTDQSALDSETNLSANQSRMNFDYRQKTEGGDLRAFIEGDFEGDGESFRLRHAFGQYQDLLAGKTWSAFYDAQAAPEEVDFEGINGRVIVRQTQIRYFPQIGKDLQWMISLEDPNPTVTGGTGVSDLPDLVTSIRRNWSARWHVKTALLLRQLRSVNNAGTDAKGQPCTPADGTIPGDSDAAGCTAIAKQGSTEKETGWGLTTSGKVQAPWLHPRDNFMYQLNIGKGIGRYINDLSSVEDLGVDGGQDAVIEPATGDVKALPVIAGYIAYQHWWGTKLRSTFLLSQVYVDNEDFQPDNAYHKTARASANLIWSPTRNVDLGSEFMWGKRTNKNDENGTATQLQFEAVYRF